MDQVTRRSPLMTGNNNDNNNKPVCALSSNQATNRAAYSLDVTTR